MNRIEHLLTCLAEEAAEVQQAVFKALRFGLDDGYPGTTRTNCGDIVDEVTDLLAIVQMLQESSMLPPSVGYQGDIDEKKCKVIKWMLYAEEKGMLK